MGLPANTKIPESWRRLEPHPELANEEITVIFVEHRDNQKIRKIFNKVNKYAKQTSRSDNIITSDDDIYAVISRRLIKEGGPLAPVPVAGSFLPDFAIDIVNTKNNTLSLRSKNLTTLSALYTITETLLKDGDYSTKVLPAEEELEEAYQTVAEFWNILLTQVNAFKAYMDLTKEDQPVSTLRETNLLMKPVTQMALAHAARYAASKGISWTVMAERLNRINWSFDNEFWFNILVIPTANRKMITGKESIRGAGLAITYLAMGGRGRLAGSIFAMQSYVVIGSNCVPIPGAMGVADYLMLDGFENFLPADLVVSMELLSRSLSFYICVLLCGMFVFFMSVRKRKEALH